MNIYGGCEGNKLAMATMTVLVVVMTIFLTYLYWFVSRNLADNDYENFNTYSDTLMPKKQNCSKKITEDSLNKALMGI